MTVAGRQAELIDDLLVIEDVQERLGVVVSRAAKRSLPDTEKTDAHRVQGCVSNVWLVADQSDGVWHFRCDADSPMVKGLVALLCDVYDGGRAEEIVSTEPELWSRLQFAKMLSPTRLNGLAAVRARIKSIALGAAT